MFIFASIWAYVESFVLKNVYGESHDGRVILGLCHAAVKGLLKDLMAFMCHANTLYNFLSIFCFLFQVKSLTNVKSAARVSLNLQT